MSLGGHVADLARRGISPRQHHDPEWGIPERIVTYSARVVRNPKRDPLDLAGADIEDPTVEFGDDLGWHLWAAASPAKRECSAWFAAAAPSVVQGNQVVPLRGPDQPDDRFSGRAQATPSWATQFPGLWTGLAGAGTEEFDQLETWHPDFLGLVAPNAGGSGQYGTKVFDLTAGSAIDRNRWAYLQSLVSVVPLGGGGCGVSGDALALQLGHSGQDGLSGGGLYVEWFAAQPAVATKTRLARPKKLRKVTGVTSYREGSGPFLTGGEGDTHRLGVDKDGHPINAIHLSTEALWKGLEGDGPFAFRGELFEEPEPDGPFLQRTYLRWNPAHSHTFCAGNRPGRWEWETPTWFYVPDPEEKPDPQPPPKGDRFPPLVQPEPEIPDTIFGQPIPPGQLVRPQTGGLVLPPPPEFVGAVGRPQTGGFVPPPPEFYGAVGRGGVKLVSDDAASRPNYPQAVNCMIFAGGTVNKAVAWGAGELDFTGALGLSPEARELLLSAPATSKTQGFAPGVEGNGSWFDWLLADQGAGTPGMAMSSSAGAGDVYLPPDRAIWEVMADEDYGGPGVALYVPTKSSCVVWGNPSPTGGFSDSVSFAPKDDGSDVEVTYYDSSGTGTSYDLADAFAGNSPHPSGEPGQFADGSTGASADVVSGWKTVEYTLSDGGGGSEISTPTPIPTGCTIVHVRTYITVEFDGSGTSPGLDSVNVGIASDQNKWGNTGDITADSKSGRSTYTADPHLFITGSGSSDGYVKVYANAFTFNGSGEIKVVITYEDADDLDYS